jgi:hypothetical protein
MSILRQTARIYVDNGFVAIFELSWFEHVFSLHLYIFLSSQSNLVSFAPKLSNHIYIQLTKAFNLPVRGTSQNVQARPPRISRGPPKMRASYAR